MASSYPFPRTRVGVRRRIDSRREAIQHAQHFASERARTDDPILSATQLGCRDGLHRLCNLLRVLDGAYPPSEIDEGRHDA